LNPSRRSSDRVLFVSPHLPDSLSPTRIHKTRPIVTCFLCLGIHSPWSLPPSKHKKHGHVLCVFLIPPPPPQLGRVFCVRVFFFTLPLVPPTFRTQKTRLKPPYFPFHCSLSPSPSFPRMPTPPTGQVLVVFSWCGACTCLNYTHMGSQIHDEHYPSHFNCCGS
jgi:hypothetical protein